jgi:hypothetical protein
MKSRHSIVKEIFRIVAPVQDPFNCSPFFTAEGKLQTIALKAPLHIFMHYGHCCRSHETGNDR